MKETRKVLNGIIKIKSKGKQISTESNGDESKSLETRLLLMVLTISL